MVRSMLTPFPPVPSNCYGARASACLGILIVVPIFFFLYDAVAHRNQPLPIVGSTMPRPDAPEISAGPSNLPNVADENAAAPIPSVHRLTPAKSETVLKPSVATKNIKTATRLKRQPDRIAGGRMYPEARAAYAQAPVYGFTPWARPQPHFAGVGPWSPRPLSLF